MFNYMKSLIVIFVLAAKKAKENSVGDVREQDSVTNNMDVNLKEKVAAVVAVKSEVNPIECKLEKDPDNWELTADNDDDYNSPPPHSPMELDEESSEDSAKHDNGKEANLEVEPPTATLTRSFNFRKRAKSINYVEEEGLNNDNSDSDFPEPTDTQIIPATDLSDATRISKKKFACNICKKSFNTGSHLKAHLSRSHFLLPFKCEQCHYRCRTNQQLVIHKTKMHSVKTAATTILQTNTPKRCNSCLVQFTSFRKLKKHRRESFKCRRKLEEFPCDICGAHVKGLVRFSDHMKKHKTPMPPDLCERLDRFRQVGYYNTPKPSTCSICQEQFESFRKLSLHRKQSTKCFRNYPRKPVPCPICKMEFSSVSKMKAHRRQSLKCCEKPSAFTCDICGASVKGLVRFSKHMKKHNDNTSKPSHLRKKRIQRTIPLSCPTCKQEFMSSRKLQEHRRDSLNCRGKLETFTCEICGGLLKGLNRFNNHMNLVHKTPLPSHLFERLQKLQQVSQATIEKEANRVFQPKKKIICNECPELKFPTYPKLYLHREECHGLQRTIKCTVDGCDKMYFNVGSLRGHMREHEKKFNCHLCSRKLATNGKLRQHLRVHAQEKNHACQFCGKMFVALSGLKIHLDIHMGIKDYKCSYCDKAFCQKFALVCHERTHTKEKPFLCKFCGKGFGTQSVLRTHEKIHEKLGSSVILRRPFRKTIAGGSKDGMGSMNETPPPDQSLQPGTSSGI